jgi:hypothetical protein
VFAPVEATFDLVAGAVGDRVERRWPAAACAAAFPVGDLSLGSGIVVRIRLPRSA